MRGVWYALAAVVGLAALWPVREASAADSELSELAPVNTPIVPASTQPSVSTVTPPNVVSGVKKKREAETKRPLAPEQRQRFQRRGLLALAFLAPAWVGGLVIFYVNWIKFHSNYIVEFLAPLTVLAGVGAYLMWQRFSRSDAVTVQQQPVFALAQRLAAIIFLGVLGWAWYLSNYITFVYEHTGTFHQGSVKQAAAWAAEHIPLDEPIFTGAAAVPYLSGHHTALDIAHPRWYAYEFTRKDTERLNTFLPSIEEMLAAYRSANWFLRERQTGFSFLMEYSEIEAGLETDWEVVREIENDSNTLTFYRRIRPAAF